MIGFLRKSRFIQLVKGIFLMHLISRIPAYPHRVRKASSPSVDPPTLKFGRHLFTIPISQKIFVTAKENNSFINVFILFI